MAFLIVPVLSKSAHHVKTVRVVDERHAHLVLHPDGAVEFVLPDGDRVDTRAEAIARHEDLREAARIAREIVGDGALAPT